MNNNMIISFDPANSTGGLALSQVGTGTSWVKMPSDNDMVDFCELVLAVLGHDITYQDFQKMSKVERNSLLRDIKIKRVLD